MLRFKDSKNIVFEGFEAKMVKLLRKEKFLFFLSKGKGGAH